VRPNSFEVKRGSSFPDRAMFHSVVAISYFILKNVEDRIFYWQFNFYALG